MKRKIKVVIADDIEVIAKQLKSIVIESEKVEKVSIALDGEEEMTQIINLEPDIVLTDMKMPKRTGLEVIETVHCNQCVSKIPKFVLITGDRDYKLIEESRKLGFDIEYKPIDPERIKQIIDDFEIIEE